MTIRPTIRPHIHCSLLGLAVAALLGGAACDPEGELDRDSTELEDVGVPLERVPTGPQDLVVAGDAPVTALTYIHTYEGGHTLGHIADGDVIMLKNFSRGYLGCNGDNDTVSSSAPNNGDPYLWEVHLTDLDGDGTDEIQLERTDGSNDTEIYLKMDADGSVFCGSITGPGDAAAWNIGSQYAALGAVYRRVASNLVNYKQDQCLKVNGDGMGFGTGCDSYTNSIFFFEVVASPS